MYTQTNEISLSNILQCLRGIKGVTEHGCMKRLKILNKNRDNTKLLSYPQTVQVQNIDKIIEHNTTIPRGMPFKTVNDLDKTLLRHT